MRKVNQIVLCRETWKENLAETIGKQLLILLQEGEYCKVKLDDCGIVIIEHDHDNEQEWWGGNSLEWLTEDEADNLDSYRLHKDDPDEEGEDSDDQE